MVNLVWCRYRAQESEICTSGTDCESVVVSYLGENSFLEKIRCAPTHGDFGLPYFLLKIFNKKNKEDFIWGIFFFFFFSKTNFYPCMTPLRTHNHFPESAVVLYLGENSFFKKIRCAPTVILAFLIFYWRSSIKKIRKILYGEIFFFFFFQKQIFTHVWHHYGLRITSLSP